MYEQAGNIDHPDHVAKVSRKAKPIIGRVRVMSQAKHTPIEPSAEANLLSLTRDRGNLEQDENQMRALRDREIGAVRERIRAIINELAEPLYPHFETSLDPSHNGFPACLSLKERQADDSTAPLGTLSLQSAEDTGLLIVKIGDRADPRHHEAFRIVLDRVQHDAKGSSYDCLWLPNEYFGYNLLDSDECVRPDELLNTRELANLLVGSLIRFCRTKVLDPVEERSKKGPGPGIYSTHA